MQGRLEIIKVDKGRSHVIVDSCGKMIGIQVLHLAYLYYDRRWEDLNIYTNSDNCAFYTFDFI